MSKPWSAQVVNPGPPGVCGLMCEEVGVCRGGAHPVCFVLDATTLARYQVVTAMVNFHHVEP